MDEIKVRWKKAALENCTGIPCIVTPPAPSFTCGVSTISDLDNNLYNTILIGTQCWTKENLRVTQYSDGTAIPLDATGSSNGISLTWQNLITGAYTIYDNQASSGANATNYGFLYNWYAATDSRKLCPTGWHVPTDAEWTTLTTFIGTNPGTKLQKNDALWSTNTGTDNYGFSALPGSWREYNGQFFDIRNYAFFWSATPFDSIFGYYRSLYANDGNVYRTGNTKSIGGSVRCVKD